MKTIKEFLQQEIKQFSRIGYPALMHRFVERNGLVMQPIDVIPSTIIKGKAKSCFMNATHLSYQGYRYVEGYAYRPGLPMLISHAWVIDDKGRVIDNTWDNPSGCQYLGVPFSSDVLTGEIFRTGVYGLLDTGMGINADFLFRQDPGLQQFLEDYEKRHNNE